MKLWKTILALAVLTALLAGCAAPQTSPAPAPEPEPAPEGEEITLFVPDADAMYLEEVPATLYVTPQGIIDALAEAGALPEGVTMNGFTLDGGHIELDLSQAFREAVASSGTAGEQLLLASLTNTFLRAYDAEDLRLTCDGEDLETGHEVYDYPLEFTDIAK